MALTKIRGNEQIIAGTVYDAQIASAAGIQTSKLAEGALFVKKDGSVPFTSTIAGVDPVNAQDLATKNYVDSVAQSLDIKASVRALATSNNTLTGLQTLDGVALDAGDRVLVIGQTTASANGIYIANSGAWTRSSDASTNATVTPGMFAFVEEGTVNADTGWVLSTNGPITLGTTNLEFTQFSSAGIINAGNGLIKTGNTLNVVSANGGIASSSGQIALTVDPNATLVVTSAGVKLADLATAKILIGNASNVATAQSVSGDISITSGGVFTVNNGAINGTKIAANAAIALSQLATGTAPGQIIVTNASNVPAYVTASGDATISATGKISLAAGAVTSTTISPTAGILPSQLATASAGQIIVANATGIPSYVTATGDASISATGAITVGNGAITGAKIAANAAIALTQLASGAAAQIIVANSSGVPTYVSASGDVSVASSGAMTIAAGAVNGAKIAANAAIALTQLASGSAGQVVVANSSGVPTYVTLTGDVNVSSSGVATVSASSVVKLAKFVTRETPNGTADGVNAVFTLANVPVTGTEQVFLNGVLQDAGASNDYTISGAAITFTFSPLAGDKVRVNYISQ